MKTFEKVVGLFAQALGSATVLCLAVMLLVHSETETREVMWQQTFGFDALIALLIALAVFAIAVGLMTIALRGNVLRALAKSAASAGIGLAMGVVIIALTLGIAYVYSITAVPYVQELLNHFY